MNPNSSNTRTKMREADFSVSKQCHLPNRQKGKKFKKIKRTEILTKNDKELK